MPPPSWAACCRAAHHMTLSETEFYKAIQIKEQRHFPGEYEYVSYTIAQLCSALTEFANSWLILPTLINSV